MGTRLSAALSVVPEFRLSRLRKRSTVFIFTAGLGAAVRTRPSPPGATGLGDDSLAASRFHPFWMVMLNPRRRCGVRSWQRRRRASWQQARGCRSRKWRVRRPSALRPRKRRKAWSLNRGLVVKDAARPRRPTETKRATHGVACATECRPGRRGCSRRGQPRPE